MPIKPEHLDELLSGYEKPEDLLGEEGLFKQLKEVLLERALAAELTHHLGYEKGDPAGRGSGNHRNGTYPKTMLTEDGAVEIDMPRDRNSTFEPQIVPKSETRLDGFDDKIISLYARSLTVQEIQGHLRANQLRLWFVSMVHVLIAALRRIGLASRRFADATCGTIRLKLLKIGTLARLGVRRLKFAMSSVFPYQDEDRHAYLLLGAGAR